MTIGNRIIFLVNVIAKYYLEARSVQEGSISERRRAIKNVRRSPNGTADEATPLNLTSRYTIIRGIDF